MNKYNFILLVFLVASCNPGHNKRVRVDSGFKHGEANRYLLFSSSSIGTRRGHTVKDSIPWGAGKGLGLFNALCWRTVDSGHNWTSQKITDGTFQNLIMKGDIVYAVIYSGGGDDKKFQCKINNSRDLGETSEGGKTWNTLHTTYFTYQNFTITNTPTPCPVQKKTLFQTFSDARTLIPAKKE